ncbi:MAG: AAA family ATPase [Deltaproteobacteria bacterium]|nr:AAA family ATPase [Deltaproteobacteria bacterium]
MSETILQGTLERITFQNPESRFLIGRFLPEGHKAVVTVKGMLFNVHEGQPLRLWGSWEEHKEYGRQFAVANFMALEPTTRDGLERYLGSGILPGVGKTLAARMVKTFGEDTFRVLDEEPERLLEVPKINQKLVDKIKAGWSEQKGVREMMVFLHGLGISQAYAERIWKTYGPSGMEVVKDNPYRLALDVSGIGFRIADAIAQKNGVDRASPQRAEAGVIFALEEITGEGHTCYPEPMVVERAAKILEISPQGAAQAVGELVKAGLLRRKEGLALAEDGTLLVPPALYRPRYDRAEEHIARDLRRILTTRGPALKKQPMAQKEQYEEHPGEQEDWQEGKDGKKDREENGEQAAARDGVLVGKGAGESGSEGEQEDEREEETDGELDIDRELSKLEGESGITLDPEQRAAVEACLHHKVVILTGGPGTGKTTIVRFVLELLGRRVARVALAAPTGKAAKRLSETTGRAAFTLHRLLEAGPAGFERDEDRPLELDLLIVDECSMIDTLLMEALLDALPPAARLVLVGDVDQLPSVGAGMVLNDLIASGVFPVSRLEKIHRQGRLSRITQNAHLVRKGLRPELTRLDTGELEDFYFIREGEPERVAQLIQTMVCQRIPARFGLDPKTDVQVISPMRKGTTGVDQLNHMLQDALNPGGAELTYGERRYRVGDRVMQIKNDYEKVVFNGDMGEITGFDREEGMLTLTFDGREVPYAKKELDRITLGYAITVHKSQGSEYPAVIIPLTTHHAIMLRRNLLYTALTRGKQLVVVVGTERAIDLAIHNARQEVRYTGLRRRLEGAE